MQHYFRQAFSQVTNPPIDSLRENRVMSLKTRLGNLGNVLDENAEQCDLLQLESPVLSNGRVRRHARLHGQAHVCVIDCTVPITDGRDRPARRHRAHPARGGGRRAGRLHPRHRHRRAPGPGPRADPDDPGHRGDPYAPDEASRCARSPASTCALGRVRRRARVRGADRCGRHRDQRVSGAGDASPTAIAAGCSTVPDGRRRRYAASRRRSTRAC